MTSIVTSIYQLILYGINWILLVYIKVRYLRSVDFKWNFLSAHHPVLLATKCIAQMLGDIETILGMESKMTLRYFHLINITRTQQSDWNRSDRSLHKQLINRYQLIQPCIRLIFYCKGQAWSCLNFIFINNQVLHFLLFRCTFKFTLNLS